MRTRVCLLIGLAVLLLACAQLTIVLSTEPSPGREAPAVVATTFSVPASTVTLPPPSTPTPTLDPTATLTPTSTIPPTPTETAQPVCLRIMPLGDSITVGVPYHQDYGGYRNLLGTLLTNDGYGVDFVGSQQDGPLPDPDHEGHSGWMTFNLMNAIDSEGWLETYQPDIILLHIGTNDIDRGYAASAPENLSALLDDILLRLPEAHIIVAQIIPYSWGLLAEHIDYNTAILGLLASREPRVSLVNMQDILTPEDFVDTYHPNIQGYDKMARAWEAAITALVPALSDTLPCEVMP